MSQPNSGKASREVVQGLINDMRDFTEVVANEILIMLNKKEQLGESWKDAQYQQFSNFIDELKDALVKDLVILDDAATALQNKVNMY